MLEKIAGKFGIASFIYCRVDDWKKKVSFSSFGKYDNAHVALSYALISAKTFKPMSTINGSDSNSDEGLNMSNVDKALNTMAAHLAFELLPKL